jgi:hypothetical protein
MLVQKKILKYISLNQTSEITCKHVKLIGYKFDAPDAHFDYSSVFSDAQVKKLEIRKKKWKLKEAVGWKPNRVPWNWAKSVEG